MVFLPLVKFVRFYRNLREKGVSLIEMRERIIIESEETVYEVKHNLYVSNMPYHPVWHKFKESYFEI